MRYFAPLDLGPYPGILGYQRWLAEFGQGDKWRVCLKAAMMPRIRSEHDEADPPDA
jgi:hypothetical protein